MNQNETLGIAIDPGLSKGLGWALFTLGDGRLVRAGFERGRDAFRKLPIVPTVIEGALELPVVRSTGYQKGRQSDIIQLAVVVGQIRGAYPHVRWQEVTPEQWKKQIPPKIADQRVRERLTKEELTCVQVFRPDVWAAIGLGFHCFSKHRALLCPKR